MVLEDIEFNQIIMTKRAKDFKLVDDKIPTETDALNISKEAKSGLIKSEQVKPN